MTTVLEPVVQHERQGGPWSYISPSRLSLFLKCPLAWKLKYIDGVRTPTSPALFIGKRVHAGLERHYRQRMLGLAIQPADVTSQVLSSWEQSAAEEDVSFEMCDV